MQLLRILVGDQHDGKNGRNGNHKNERPKNGHVEWVWTGKRFVTAHKNPRGRYVDQRNVSIHFWTTDDGIVMVTLRAPKGEHDLEDLDIETEVLRVRSKGQQGCEVLKVRIPFDGRAIEYDLRQRDRVILPAD